MGWLPLPLGSMLALPTTAAAIRAEETFAERSAAWRARLRLAMAIFFPTANAFPGPALPRPRIWPPGETTKARVCVAPASATSRSGAGVSDFRNGDPPVSVLRVIQGASCSRHPRSHGMSQPSRGNHRNPDGGKNGTHHQRKTAGPLCGEQGNEANQHQTRTHDRNHYSSDRRRIHDRRFSGYGSLGQSPRKSVCAFFSSPFHREPFGCGPQDQESNERGNDYAFGLVPPKVLRRSQKAIR